MNVTLSFSPLINHNFGHTALSLGFHFLLFILSLQCVLLQGVRWVFQKAVILSLIFLLHSPLMTNSSYCISQFPPPLLCSAKPPAYEVMVIQEKFSTLDIQIEEEWSFRFHQITDISNIIEKKNKDKKIFST